MQVANSLVVVALASVASACNSDELGRATPAQRAPQTDASHAQVGRPETVRSDERLFADLAEAAPSTAGFYLDESGQLVIRVVDSRQESAVREYIAAKLSQRTDLASALGRNLRGLRLERGEYTFHQLAAWRDAAASNVLGKVDGVRLLDLDESRNRIMLGLDSRTEATARKASLEIMAALGVDTAAIYFRILTKDLRFDFAPPSTLQGYTSDPLAGGFQITDGPDGCSLGFVAQRNGTTGFVTASHCSSAMYVTDGTSFNALIGSSSTYIGSEAYDAPGYSCGVFTCRGSDATWVPAASGVSMSVGRILRTTGVNNGSLTIDTSNSYFDVVESGSDLVYGQQVHKVGRTTGWTSGSINGTCVDAYPSGMNKVTCAYGAGYTRGKGDSGGPVFFRLASGDSTEVSLIGVHSSEDGFGGGLFSKLERIKNDLGGSWTVIAHAPTPPSGPLSVTVAGPDDVDSSPSCNPRYWANVTGGTGAYTYTWTTDGTITTDWGSTVWTQFTTPGGHWIQVVVSDGVNTVSSGHYTLTSSTSGMTCTN